MVVDLALLILHTEAILKCINRHIPNMDPLCQPRTITVMVVIPGAVDNPMHHQSLVEVSFLLWVHSNPTLMNVMTVILNNQDRILHIIIDPKLNLDLVVMMETLEKAAINNRQCLIALHMGFKERSR